MSERVALVGAGSVARAVHLPILSRRSELFEVAGLCDLSAEATKVAGDRFGIPPSRRFDDLEEMLGSGDLDGLLVLTSGSHAIQVLAGLEAGLAVFSEKPLAYTLKELEKIGDRLEAGSGRLMVGYMKAYDPAVELARERLALVGEVRAVDVTVLHPSAASQFATSELDNHVVSTDPSLAEALEDASRALEEEALGGAAPQLGPLYTGVLLGSIVHDLAVLRRLGLDLRTVEQAERWPTEAFPPSVRVLGRTGDGVRVDLRWHYLAEYPAYREEVRVHGELGSLELVFPSPYLLRAPTELTITRKGEHGHGQELWLSHHEAFERELVAFHELMTGGSLPHDGLEEARADTEICQMIAVALAEAEDLALGGEAGAFRG